MPSNAWVAGSQIVKWTVEQHENLSGESQKTLEAIARSLAGGEPGIKIAKMLATQIAAEKIVEELKDLEDDAVQVLRELFKAGKLAVLF